MACNNPFVKCIGHPTGRLIEKRAPYPADWAKVFKTAFKTGTAMEINAQPDRMDLNEELSKQAREAGVKLVISTDSHAQNNFAFMDLGVFIARRAWCNPEAILNTQSCKNLSTLKPIKTKPGISVSTNKR